jgi:hypothetical protein
MTATPMRLAVIIASTRAGRFGETVGRWLVTRAQQHDDLKLDVIDLYDLQLPDSLEHSPQSAAYTARVDAAGVFVVVTPSTTTATRRRSNARSTPSALNGEPSRSGSSPTAVSPAGRAVEPLRQVFAELYTARAAQPYPA